MMIPEKTSCKLVDIESLFVARRTAEYWKDEHLAGNARIKSLEAALKRIACMMEEISPTLYENSQIWCEATEALNDKEVEMLKLRPCPFCGGEPNFDYDDAGRNWIECSQCHFSSNASVSAMEDCKPILAESWNQRVDDAAKAIIKMIQEDNFENEYVAVSEDYRVEGICGFISDKIKEKFCLEI